ncbi:MAG TPA: helix-turn-helix transcriptional regulator, partial [Flavobacteriales bacterium]|nr:helix-turn-helix transcriptional regulator [Flavobacteriales bacterium]
TVVQEDLYKALDHVRIAGFHYNEVVSKELRREVEEELHAHPPDEVWAKLTPREREFVLCYTRSNVPTLEDAARRMGIKPDTAETYRKNVAHKLNAHSKAEMVRKVLENGWG